MLKCYPVAATQENWLHEALIDILLLIHQKIDDDELVINNQATWRHLVETTVPIVHQAKIKSLRGIRDRLFSYKDELIKLDSVQRRVIISAMTSQNLISDLLGGIEPIQIIKQTHPQLHIKANELFVFAFEKLTDLKVRERQYEIIFNSLNDKICSFCGIERVMDPEETAQDQDHYLAKSIYPFAAANMRNLVPMCRCCNRDYKKAKNVIIGDDDVRRKAFDPYNSNAPIISLTNSDLIPETSPINIDWTIEFLSHVEEAETWDQVFSIRTRYKRDILNRYFDTWLRGFMLICAKKRAKGRITPDFSPVQIRQQLQSYQEDKTDHPNIGLAGFLEPLAFSFLLSKYDEGHPRVINLIRDAVLGIPIDDVA
ncbi:hypothetical protein AB6E63_13210 [Vibrio cyclitrophicus]